MDDTFIKQIQETIEVTVTKVVNGKIDKISEKIDSHNVKHEADMVRILPVLEAYETAQTSGKLLMKVGGGITVVGGAWLVLKSIFPSL